MPEKMTGFLAVATVSLMVQSPLSFRADGMAPAFCSVRGNKKAASSLPGDRLPAVPPRLSVHARRSTLCPDHGRRPSRDTGPCVPPDPRGPISRRAAPPGLHPSRLAPRLHRVTSASHRCRDSIARFPARRKGGCVLNLLRCVLNLLRVIVDNSYFHSYNS